MSISKFQKLQYGMDEFSRLRFLSAYSEQSAYSSIDFLKRLLKWYACGEIRMECVQTDNGFKFTNRFSNSKRDIPTLFKKTAAQQLALHNRRFNNLPIRPLTWLSLIEFLVQHL